MIVPWLRDRNERAHGSICGTLATTSKRYEAQLPLLVPHGTFISGEQHAGGVRTADERLITRKDAKRKARAKKFLQLTKLTPFVVLPMIETECHNRRPLPRRRRLTESFS